MAQIRIAVCDTDTAYTERFVRYMEKRLGEETQLIPVLEREKLDEIIRERNVQAVLISEEWETEYPPFIGTVRVGYLTSDVSQKDKIFRYQNVRNLTMEVEKLLKQEDDSVKIIVFAGAADGVGTSTAAAAYAQGLAMKEKTVLYLNMNSLGDAESIFQGGNPRDLSFFLEQMKEGKEADAALAGVLNRHVNGVYFVDNAVWPQALAQAKAEVIRMLFEELRENGKFRYIIVDSDFAVSSLFLEACALADRVVLVQNGSAAASRKILKEEACLRTLEKESCPGLLQKTVVLKNQYQKQTDTAAEGSDLQVVGTIPMLSEPSAEQLVSRIAGMDVLAGILR